MLMMTVVVVVVPVVVVTIIRNFVTNKTVRIALQAKMPSLSYILNFISPNGSNKEIKDNNNNDTTKVKIQ